jgi:hypothetical protein
MKHISKLKIWLSIIIAFFIAFNTISLESLYAQATSNPYEKSSLTIYELEKLYHTRINDLFNAKLQLLEKGEKGPGISKIPSGDECEEKNYTTFCLATTAAKEYKQYNDALSKRKTYVKIESEEGVAITLEKATTAIVSQTNEINIELQRAKRALDTALKTYNEISIAHRMHLQYQNIIESLTKYKNKVNKLYNEVEPYPSKFVDATTNKCL